MGQGRPRPEPTSPSLAGPLRLPTSLCRTPHSWPHQSLGSTELHRAELTLSGLAAGGEAKTQKAILSRIRTPSSMALKTLLTGRPPPFPTLLPPGLGAHPHRPPFLRIQLVG